MALRNLAASPGVDANREAIIEQGGFDVIARALQIAGEIHYIFSYIPGSEICTLRYEKLHQLRPDTVTHTEQSQATTAATVATVATATS